MAANRDPRRRDPPEQFDGWCSGSAGCRPTGRFSASHACAPTSCSAPRRLDADARSAPPRRRTQCGQPRSADYRAVSGHARHTRPDRQRGPARAAPQRLRCCIWGEHDAEAPRRDRTLMERLIPDAGSSSSRARATCLPRATRLGSAGSSTSSCVTTERARREPLSARSSRSQRSSGWCSSSVSSSSRRGCSRSRSTNWSASCAGA